MKLRTRILASYVAISLIPLLALAFWSWFQIARFVTAQLELSAADSTRRVARSLAAELRMIDNVSIAVFADSRTRGILARPQSDYPMKDQLADMAYLLAFLRSFQESEDLILRLRLLVPEGRVYSNQKVNLVSAQSAPEIASALAALAARSGETTLLSFRNPEHRYFAVPDVEPLDVVSFVRPLPPFAQGGGFAGAVIVDVLTRDIRSVVERSSILDQAVFTVGHGSELLLTVPLGIRGPETADPSLPPPGMHRLDQVPVYHDWWLGGYVPFNEVFRENVAWRNDMLILSLLVAGLCYVLSVVVARTSTRRIIDLSITMRSLDYADLAGVTVSGDDEVSELQVGFNQLLERLRQALKENYQAGLRARQAEMNLLQAQINPHFLYNTLEMLSGIAHDMGSSRMERIVRTMADYYRFSLRKGRNVVSLAEELHHVDRYVEIENERRGSSIVLLSSIPEPYLAVKLPRITLQPIVENAVQHGIARKPDPRGTVFVSAHRRDDAVVVTVRDDGVGMSADRLRQVLAPGSEAEETGYGIRSVRDRLKVLYGDAADLRLESDPGSGTRVSIVLPLTGLEASSGSALDA